MDNDIRNIKISIIGLGFVGNAMYESFKKRNVDVICIYDKYKNGGIGDMCNTVNSDIIFLALPTHYHEENNEYDKTALYEVCNQLNTLNYTKNVVIKSTIEPLTTDTFQKEFPNMNFYHNPEFLTARTAVEDFDKQTHIVIGKPNLASTLGHTLLHNFYSHFYPNAEISLCNSTESECMKIYCNCFYAVKIQFMTELYELTNKLDCSFENIKNLMLKNKWINPMHTQIPGHDGKISYGGMCFPKDTTALNAFMNKYNSPNLVLQSTINERNTMRNDKVNILNSK